MKNKILGAESLGPIKSGAFSSWQNQVSKRPARVRELTVLAGLVETNTGCFGLRWEAHL